MVGRASNPIEVLGKRTVGATILIMRALYETGGSFTIEHPLRSRIWSFKCFQAIMGWEGVQRSRIDQCEFGLAPGDAPHKRYLKPTFILHFSPKPFVPKQCCGVHEHIKMVRSTLLQVDMGQHL